MPEAARLTVAVAAMDRPAALARCLDALLSGAQKPAEVIVVDQSRGDAVGLVVARRQAAETSLVYVRQARRGLAASRNLAFASARYPIVAVTDDDCVPDGGWVAAAAQTCALPGGPDAMTGRVLPLGPEEPGTYAVSSRSSTVRRDFSGKAIPWLAGTGANCVLRREWFERAGGYDERLGAGSPGQAGEDIDFLYRLLKAGACIRYEPDAVIYHERQSQARRMASRWSYGHGIGAFCGIWLRRGDPYALRMLSYWLYLQFKAMAGGMLERSVERQAHQKWLILRGTARGLIYGLRAGPARRIGRQDAL